MRGVRGYVDAGGIVKRGFSLTPNSAEDTIGGYTDRPVGLQGRLPQAFQPDPFPRARAHSFPRRK